MLDRDFLLSSIRGNRFVRSMEILDRVDSTQDAVRERAAMGAPEGTVVLAEAQTRGRGSRGRSWFSMPGTGLYMSMLLRPRESMSTVPRWTLVCAAAACAAFRDLGIRSVIRWPNDLLVDGRKVAGILAEAREEAAGPVLVLGLGVNVNHTQEDFPLELAPAATSLSLEAGGKKLSPEAVVAGILCRFEALSGLMYHDRWEEVRDLWTEFAPDAVGRSVVVRSSGETASRPGTTDGVDASGALRVRFQDGTEAVVHSSEALSARET